MSSPFANGSAVAPPTQQKYHEPIAQQPAGQYWDQSYRNLSREDASIQRELDRERQLERGRVLAGFTQRDRRAEQLGFVWERTRSPAWPAEVPVHIRAKVDQAIAADRSARAALATAEQSFALWRQQHQAATPERARVKYEELTEDLLPAAERIADQLDRVLIAAAAVVEALDNARQVSQAAPGRRAAIERQYQQQLEQVDRDLQAARMAAQQAIAQF